MASSILYLDKRRRKDNGEYPIKIMITHRSRFMINTGISCLASEWKGRQITKGANSRAKNAAINNKKTQIDKILLSLELEGVLPSLTDAQLRSYLSNDYCLRTPYEASSGNLSIRNTGIRSNCTMRP